MKVLDVQPKDIHVTLELSMAEVIKILNCLGSAKIKFGSEGEPTKEDVEFVKGLFFETLRDLEKEFSGGH